MAECGVIRGGGGRRTAMPKPDQSALRVLGFVLATTRTRALLPHDIVRDALVDFMSQRTMLSQFTRWLYEPIRTDIPVALWLILF